MPTKFTPGRGPKCPNHNVALQDCHNGIGICPISHCRFEYEGDEDEKKEKMRINALGQMEKVVDWDVKQVDGGSGG